MAPKRYRVWHLWQDQIQGIGIDGGSIETWLNPKAFGSFALGLGRFGKCRGVRGGEGLVGEVGPESMRRLEGSKRAKDGLNLPICPTA